MVTYMVGFEPRREDYLDDESFERADDDYWAWYDAQESKRK